VRARIDRINIPLDASDPIMTCLTIISIIIGVIYSISHVLNRNYDAKKSAKGMPGEGDKMIPKETEMV